MPRFAVSINPWTGAELNRYPLLSLPQIKQKLPLISKYQKHEWALNLTDRTSCAARLSKLLVTQSDEHAHLIHSEMGKSLEQAKHEILKCANLVDYYVRNSERHLKPIHPVEPVEGFNVRTEYRPIGLILGIMPWNFPYWQVIRWAVPTLMAGNACLLKHASNVQGCAQAIHNLFEQSGFDMSFANIPVHTGDIPSIIADELIRGVALTGSENAGRSVATECGKNLKKCVVELGGSDPCIILDSVSPEKIPKIARMIVKTRMQNAGQSCISPKRVIVTEKHKAALESAIALEIENLQWALDFGPIATSLATQQIEDQVKRAQLAGARLLAAWSPDNLRESRRSYDGSVAAGTAFNPVAFTDVKPDSVLGQEEVFGPVISIISSKDSDECIEIANHSSFGLGAAVFSADTDTADRLCVESLESGMAFVNALPRSDARVPFGGIKSSGFGRECGAFGLHEFCNAKSIWVRYS